MMDFVTAEWWLQTQLSWKDNWKLQNSSTESTEAQKNKGQNHLTELVIKINIP